MDLVALEYEWFLNAEIIRKGIEARPHQRHSYDFEKSRCLLDGVLQMSDDAEVDF